MIEFKGVRKQYNHGVTALDDVNLKIEKGEFVFIEGPSGSGKSTFLKLLIKEEDVTNGQIIVAEQEVNKLKDKEIPFFRRKIGFVFQDFRLLYDRTVYDNISFALHVIGTSDKEIARQVPLVTKLVGLEGKEGFFPNQLSGGEQQRVALARAIVTNPPIIIADEPTGNLDSETARGIMEILYEVNKKGATVIVVSHDSNLIKASGKRVISMKKGKIVNDTGSFTASNNMYSAVNNTVNNTMGGIM